MEDPVQLSSNSKETSTDSFLQTVEEIEEFLKDVSETYKARTSAAPEQQLDKPPTAHGEDNQQESTQRVMTPLTSTMMISACSNIPRTDLIQNSIIPTAKALDMPPEDLDETFSMNPKVAFFDERKPTPTSWMTDTTDNPKTFTECQKVTITANKIAIPSEGSQMKMMTSDDQILYERPGITLKEGHVMTVSGNQTFTEGHTMTSSSDHSLNWNQRTALCEEPIQTLSGDQTLYGGQITFSVGQTPCGGQMKTLCDDQTPYGGQMAFSGDQIFYGGQTTTLKGGYTMTFTGDQTFTGGQMTIYSGDQTPYGNQMMTLKEDHMTTFADDHTLYGGHMMPHQSPSLPYPGFLYLSSSHLIQGQSLEKQKCNIKTQSRQFQKNSGTLKTYPCTYQDCGKSYTKPSHLRIHERKHTGEWRLRDWEVPL